MQDDADGNGRDPDADPAPNVERTPNGPTPTPPANAAEANAAEDAEAETDADAEVESDADAETDADADVESDADAESVEGVDTEHVMNLTFVLTLFIGVPTVVVLSLFVPLEGWNEIITFVVRVGAAIWFLTAVTLYVHERVRK